MYSSTAYIPQSCQGRFGKHGKEPGGAVAVQRQCKGPCRGSAAGVDLVARQTTRHSQVEGTAYYIYDIINLKASNAYLIKGLENGIGLWTSVRCYCDGYTYSKYY